MNRNDAKTLALDLMSEHGLLSLGWTFKFDRAVKRLGQCDYTKKTISLSGPNTDNAIPSQIRNTILHEIAHAHTPGAGHGPRWRAMFLAIGGDGARTTRVEVLPKSKWVGVCPEGHEFPFYRKPKRRYACLKPHTSRFPQVLTLRPNV